MLPIEWPFDNHRTLTIKDKHFAWLGVLHRNTLMERGQALAAAEGSSRDIGDFLHLDLSL